VPHHEYDMRTETAPAAERVYTHVRATILDHTRPRRGALVVPVTPREAEADRATHDSAAPAARDAS